MHRKYSIVLIITLVLLLAITMVALADDVANNIDNTVDATFETLSLVTGDASKQVDLYIVPRGGDGKSGCNLTGSTTLVISVASSTPSVATVSPSQITFTNCEGEGTNLATSVTVTPHATGLTNITFGLVSNTTPGSFELDTAQFTVNVAPPSNTPPVVDVTGVTGGANYEKGSVPSAACSVTDAEDGSQSVSPVVGLVTGPLSAYGLGSQTVTCSYTDSGGLTNTASATYAIVDTHAPTLTVPADQIAEATSASGTTVVFTVTASDAVDSDPKVTCSPASGSTFTLGPTTVSCSATDAAGNKANGSFTVTVQDTTPPSVMPPTGVTTEATSASGAPVTYSDATASDLVDGPVTATCSPASGSTFILGNTTVTCSATDSHNNTGSATFTVTVVDTTPPAVTPPAGVTAEATSASGAPVPYSDATAIDVVDGAVAATCTPTSGSTFALGTTTVTCTATDAAGNTGTGSFTVTVRDTTPPSVTPPADVTAEATSASGAPVTYSGATAIDLVDGSVAVTCSPASGSTFALGNTTVTCSATDSHNNTGSATFTVTVVDTTPPSVTPPADVTAEATSASGAPVTYSGATAIDVVDGSAG